MHYHNKKNIGLIIGACLVLSVIGIALFAPTPASAAGTCEETSGYKQYEEGWKIMPDCFTCGSCDLYDFVQLFVNLANVGLKVLPYLAMFMMIWAGFNLIMAGGNPQKIQEGKKMITSVILGVIIIVILAWAWSYFIVYALTCDPAHKETCQAKLFPGGGIWEREWWGGGEATVEHQPGTGCCIVNGFGCIDTDQTTCTSLGGPDIQTTYEGDYQYCHNFSATCQSYQVGCCVPTDPNSNACTSPGTNGCLPASPNDDPSWRERRHNQTPCDNLGQCQENP